MPRESEAAGVLARYASALKYEDLPAPVVEHTKRYILDTIGVIIAASTLGLGHRQLVSLIKEGGGRRQSTILGFGAKVPAWMAAYANGAMGRAINFDNAHDETVMHSSSVVIPACLAVAERSGKTSGRDFITAVALGDDIACRLGLSVWRRPGGLKMDEWFPSSVLGIFGATAACGRLLGLDAEKMQNALGTALFESSGTMEAFTASGQPSMMRGMITGFTAKAAVLSALMAERGITGVPESLEGASGLYRVYFDGSYDRPSLLNGLGKVFANAVMSLKPWPANRYTHSYIDATLQLVREHNIAAADIKQIRIHVAGYAKSRCEPLESQRRPLNINHASGALPYLVGATAARGRLTLRDLTGDLAKPDVLRIVDRVVPVFDERFDIRNRIGPALVEINMAGGETYSREMSAAYGHPDNPMTRDDLVAKFRDCVSYAKKPLPAGNIDRVLAMTERLEQVSDMRDITLLLA